MRDWILSCSQYPVDEACRCPLCSVKRKARDPQQSETRTNWWCRRRSTANIRNTPQSYDILLFFHLINFDFHFDRMTCVTPMLSRTSHHSHSGAKLQYLSIFSSSFCHSSHICGARSTHMSDMWNMRGAKILKMSPSAISDKKILFFLLKALWRRHYYERLNQIHIKMLQRWSGKSFGFASLLFAWLHLIGSTSTLAPLLSFFSLE